MNSFLEEYRQKKLQEERIRKRRQRNLEHWGVETAFSSTYDHKQPPIFPSTFDEVAENAYDAIRGTILGLQLPDPNAAVNAMHRSVLDYRPTHPYHASSRNLDGETWGQSNGGTSKTKTAARMGIEIDGAAYLLRSEDLRGRERSTDEGRALRILSLKIACRLASLRDDELCNGSVAVYYNSIDQTFLASNDLRRLRETCDASLSSSFDRIQILCVGQHSLPHNMLRRRRKTSTNGLILIVKPTDYNFDSPVAIENEFDSSDETKQTTYYPTIHSDIIDKLQSLLFQAAASSVPAIVISPRLSELPPLQQYSTSYRYKTGPSGFEQSGFQQSATYGGLEPPVGPTSWILRDLIPPVYVWVGCSLDLLSGAKIAGQRRKVLPSINTIIERCKQQSVDSNSAGEGSYVFYSRLALTQSSMDSGHMYHLFAVKETAEVFPDHQNAYTRDVIWKSTYEFMGSVKASLGRPTCEVMNDVFTEWTETSIVSE